MNLQAELKEIRVEAAHTAEILNAEAELLQGAAGFAGAVSYVHATGSMFVEHEAVGMAKVADEYLNFRIEAIKEQAKSCADLCERIRRLEAEIQKEERDETDAENDAEAEEACFVSVGLK